MDEVAITTAKNFLLSKVEEQALEDKVPLSEVEKQMFLFSEGSASEEMAAAAEKFDATCSDSEYERKIAKLLRHAYRRDQKLPDGTRPWKEALQALKHEDFYGLVMADQAGLPVSKQGMQLALLGMWPVAATFLAIGLPGFLVIFDPFHWGLIRSDWIRLLLLLVFAFVLWRTTNKVSASMIGRSRKS